MEDVYTGLFLTVFAKMKLEFTHYEHMPGSMYAQILGFRNLLTFSKTELDMQKIEVLLLPYVGTQRQFFWNPMLL